MVTSSVVPARLAGMDLRERYERSLGSLSMRILELEDALVAAQETRDLYSAEMTKLGRWLAEHHMIDPVSALSPADLAIQALEDPLCIELLRRAKEQHEAQRPTPAQGNGHRPLTARRR